MKKLLIIFTTTLLPILSGAQITLEHTYNDNTVTSTKISDTDFIYFYANKTNLYIYSSSHVLLKIVAHGDTSEPYIYQVSQKTFDLDAGYEFVVNSYSVNGNTYKIMNDDGSIIMNGQGSAYVYDTPDGAKLRVSTTTDTKIYDLPGEQYMIQPNEISVSDELPYPNPTASWIRLPYQLSGSTGQLQIIDVTGKLCKSFIISGMFTDVLVQSNTLPQGQYIYYFEEDGKRSKPKKFTIN